MFVTREAGHSGGKADLGNEAKRVPHPAEETSPPLPFSEWWRLRRRRLALESAIVQLTICTWLVSPRVITFANGRQVRVKDDGTLAVGWA